MTEPGSAMPLAAGGRAVSPFAQAWHGDISASRGLCTLSLCVHAVAAAIIAVLMWYRPALALLMPLVAGSYWHSRRALRLRGRHSICSVRWQPDGTWLWQTCGGAECKGRLAGATVLGCSFVL